MLLLFSRSVLSNSVTPWAAAHQASLSFTISQSLPKFMSIESVMPSNHLILCCPLLWSSVFPSIRSLPVSWFFASRGQSIGASASASVFPMSIQGWFPLVLTGWISLLSKGLSRVFSNNTVWKHWTKVKWWGLTKHCWLIVCSHVVSLSPNNDCMK